MEFFKSLDEINTMSLILVSKLQCFFFNSIPFFSSSRDYSTLKTLKSAARGQYCIQIKCRTEVAMNREDGPRKNQRKQKKSFHCLNDPICFGEQPASNSAPRIYYMKYNNLCKDPGVGNAFFPLEIVANYILLTFSIIYSQSNTIPLLVGVFGPGHLTTLSNGR